MMLRSMLKIILLQEKRGYNFVSIALSQKLRRPTKVMKRHAKQFSLAANHSDSEIARFLSGR